MRFLLVCCLLFFNFQLIKAQQVFVQKYPRDVYLAASQNWAMAEDKHGGLFIANNDGVIQYDGVKWNLIPIANQDYVPSLAIDSKDNLFVGSYNELGYIKKDGASKYKYHSLAALLPKRYQNIKDFRQTVVFNDDVFFNDTQNIYLYKNGRFKVFDIENRSLCVVKKQLFLITGKGLLVYKNGFFEDADFNKELTAIKVTRIANYENNAYLMQDENNQVWVFDPQETNDKKLRLLKENLKDYTKNTPVISITWLDNGIVAVRSTEAVVFINKEGKVVRYNSKDMLGVQLSTGFAYQDLHHNLWVGTDSYISQLITSSPLSYYDKLNGINGEVLSFGKKDKDLYVGTTKGLFYKEANATFSLIPKTDGENWNIFNFRQKLYLAHGTGVFEIEGKKATRLITHRYIQTLGEIKSRPDCFIMGTFDTGIWLLEKTGGTWHEKKIKGFEEEIRFIQADEDDNIWISHYNKGLFKLRLNKQMDSVINKTFYDAKDGLPSNFNNRLHRLNNGKIVVTTTDGIYSFNKLKNRFEPDATFKLGRGMGFCIYTLLENTNGDIYFWGTPIKNEETAGAFIKQPDGSFKLLLTPFRKISSPTHDIRIDVDAPLLAAGPNEIWIGNNEKLISYDPFQKTYYNEKVKLFIKQVWAGDSLIFSGDGKLPVNRLQFSQNKLRFSYVSSFYENPEKIEYQYKLDGFENKWSDWTTSGEAGFTNLSDGNYTFWVRAKNLYGNVSQPVSFSFHINAPWYKTWWAFVFYSILVLLIFRLSMIFYTGRIKRQKLVLERKVATKTIELRKKNEEILKQSDALQELNLTKDRLFSIISHDLRGPIGQIKQTLGLIESGDLSAKELESIIPNLNESIGSAFSLADNLLYWAKSQMEGIQVNPVWFNLIEIAYENYQLFKPNANSKNIDLVNNIDTNVQVYGDKDMIKLVLRNLINNAVKFTNSGGTITIGNNIESGYVEVFVKDTGTGLTAEEARSIFGKENFHKKGTSGENGSGLGLVLCQDFMEKNGGKITLESQPGKGSQFSFRLSLKNIASKSQAFVN
ncbi:MAG: ATP-binding protein [Mucilaginibacter sp.]